MLIAGDLRLGQLRTTVDKSLSASRLRLRWRPVLFSAERHVNVEERKKEVMSEKENCWCLWNHM